jgi:uncharacterized protein DUF1833
MPRPVSATFRAAVYGQETGEVFLQLLRLYHAQIPGGLFRFVNDTVNIISNGNEYIGCPFQINLPDEREDVMPECTLAVDNVDRSIVAAVRVISTPIEAELELIVASAPDVIEVPAQRFTMRMATWNIHTVTGSMRFEDILNERFPGGTFVRANWPGLR